MAKQARQIRETASAMMALDNELTTGKAADTSAIIAEAKRLGRLQAQRSKLRRELRKIEKAIKHSRKMLKALAGREV